MAAYGATRAPYVRPEETKIASIRAGGIFEFEILYLKIFQLGR